MPPSRELEIIEHADAEEVSMGEWSTAESTDKLFTTGLGPCAGVLVHNSKERKAALGHFVEPRMKLEGFDKFVRHARAALGEVTDQLVYLAGAAPEDGTKQSQDECAKIRQHVIETFLKNGYSKSQLKQEWNEVGQSATLAVDTESGNAVVSHLNYAELIEAAELD